MVKVLGAYSADFQKKIVKLTSDPEDLEHVGSPLISKNPSLAKIVGMNPPERYTYLNFRLAVDEIKDFKMIENIYNNLWDCKPIIYDDVILFLTNNPSLSQLNKFLCDLKINFQVSQTLESWKENVDIFYDLNL